MKIRPFRIIATVALSVLVIIFWSGSAFAQVGETAQINIVPPNPTENDNITIEISGEWPNTCAPRDPQLSVLGNEITINTSAPGDGCICGLMITPWSWTVPVGQLPVGAYHVTVAYTHLGCAPGKTIGEADFTVSEVAAGQINVITVDCTPFVSPGISSIGKPFNTMGQALQQVDPGGVIFSVNEVTPAAFRALTAAQLATYDLIAINNNPFRLGDDCVAGAGQGLGTTWHQVVGVQTGSRVVLTSHDAPRFKMTFDVPAFTGSAAGANPGPGVEPFGADDLVLSAARWAGSGSQTGLIIFNDSARFSTVGGQGWNNPELNLPAAWGITDLNQSSGGFMGGGYTDILPAFETHPIYNGLSDARFGLNSINSFAANIVDTSFHSIFGSFTSIFTPTEVVINAGIVDPGSFGIGEFAAPGPNGTAITLIRDEPPVRDHFRCYDVKEYSRLPKRYVSLKDQFRSDDRVRVGKAASLCVPVDKNGEGISDPDTHLTCYKIKPDKRTKLDVVIENQFGEQTLRVDNSKMLCVPSKKKVIGPSQKAGRR